MEEDYLIDRITIKDALRACLTLYSLRLYNAKNYTCSTGFPSYGISTKSWSIVDAFVEYRSLRKRVTSQTVTSQTSFVTSQTHPSRFANVFELFLKRLI